MLDVAIFSKNFDCSVSDAPLWLTSDVDVLVSDELAMDDTILDVLGAGDKSANVICSNAVLE